MHLVKTPVNMFIWCLLKIKTNKKIETIRNLNIPKLVASVTIIIIAHTGVVDLSKLIILSNELIYDHITFTASYSHV